MDKPNILLIMADQMTPFMTGFYGNKVVKTPNLDKLMEGGVRFNNAYTPNPVCAPARASMMTGKLTYDLKCFDNAHSFPSEEPTFCHYLNIEGYETVLSGKMHFIGPDQHHGIQRRLTTDIYPANFIWIPKMLDAEKHLMQDPYGNAVAYQGDHMEPAEWGRFINYDEETQFRAKEYLYARNKDGNNDKPFFLCVSYHNPHDPFNVPRKFYDLYKDEDFETPDISEWESLKPTIMDKWLSNGFHRTDRYRIDSDENLRHLRHAYAACVSYIDDKVGDLLHQLEWCGYKDNTIIMFTSDHGDMLGERGMVQKRHFYEWSTRIPLIMNFPDGKYAGKKVDELVSLQDVCETIKEWGGVPEETNLPTDGISLMKYVRGEMDNNRYIYSEYHGEGVMWPCFMVRDARYKYIYIHEKESRLYDLIEDPDEKHDLSGKEEYREKEEELKAAIFARFDPDYLRDWINENWDKRKIIHASNQTTNITWAYTPEFPGSDRYCR